jgi:D-alanyl-D-alanine carboxypeptidase
MRTRSPRRILLVAVGAALVLPLGVPTPAAAADPVGPEPLPMLLDELVGSGATGALIRLDWPQAGFGLASGHAALDPLTELTLGARFRIGSVTKSFIATVALMQVERGRLRLTDTVAQRLPRLAVPGAAAITLQMLLNHTSGLYDYTDDQTFLARYAADPTAGWAPRELVALAVGHPPTFAPGEGWSYTNTGYVLAGMMIEAATGQNIHRLVRQLIIDPLRLTGTSFPAHGPVIAGDHAHGYLPPAATGGDYLDVSVVAPSLAWTAGAIVSTAYDVRQFYAALLGGRLLPPDRLAEMLTAVQVDPVFSYGLGIISLRTPCGTVWGHGGDIPGYHTMAFNNRTGSRGFVLAMPTDPDQSTGPLYGLTAGVATCEMFTGPDGGAAAAAAVVRATADALRAGRLD